MKNSNFAIVGICGSFIAGALGGWDTALQTILIFMTIDYFTGLVVAGVFKKSGKTENGALESRAGWKGLAKKCMTLTFILIGVQLDKMMGSGLFILGIEFTVRNTIIIGFLFNELISIVENAGLMGLYIPPVIVTAIEVLEKQSKMAGSGESKKKEE